MSERCLCGCMDRRDRFGTFDLCPLAEAWFEQQRESAEGRSSMKQIIVTPMRHGEYADDRAQEVWEALLAQRSQLDCTVVLVDTTPPELEPKAKT